MQLWVYILGWSILGVLVNQYAPNKPNTTVRSAIPITFASQKIQELPHKPQLLPEGSRFRWASPLLKGTRSLPQPAVPPQGMSVLVLVTQPAVPPWGMSVLALVMVNRAKKQGRVERVGKGRT